MNKVKVNWDNAPEGAERYSHAPLLIHRWLKNNGLVIFYYNVFDNEWEAFWNQSSAKGDWEEAEPRPNESTPTEESSGGSCDYYKCPIKNPTTKDLQFELGDGVVYIAECNDIIENLDMTYAEANMFKEIWRSAAARTLGKKKAGHTDIRGAEKIVFFADRNLIQKKG